MARMEAGIFEDGIDDVALDLEAFVARRLLAQVTGHQVAETHAAALAIVDEQSLAALRLHALLDIDGLLLRGAEQALVGIADLPDAYREGVIQPRGLRLEALALQLGDICLHRFEGAASEGLGEVVAVLNRDLEPRAVLDGCSVSCGAMSVEKGLVFSARQWHEGQAIATKLPLDHARNTKAPASGASYVLDSQGKIWSG
jgi:hypothetical protein